MATEELIEQSKDEFQQIMEIIAQGENFLLSGGAGSGKTYSLVQVIRKVLEDNPMSKVACITYTNAAVREIRERVNHKNLRVSTIHDFLWDNIKNFQKELKSALVTLINDTDVPKIKVYEEDSVPTDYFDNREQPIKIQYKEYYAPKEGVISHDELLIVAEYMFKEYTKLCDIVKDKYPFIFIDEYQDTQESVVKILLEHFPKSDKHCIIGFFGDAMQSIYDNGIGNLNNYKGDTAGQVREVKKSQNRRNPQKIIELANKLRTDGINQKPSNDALAPNMKNGKVKDGKVLFIYSTNKEVSDVIHFLCENQGWDFENTEETKELNLTHNLIADKVGFQTLMNIYDKDQILAYHQRVVNYMNKNDVDTDFSGKTFGEVIDALKENKEEKELTKILPTSNMQNFIDENQELYKYALAIDFYALSKIHLDKDQLIDDKKEGNDDENGKGSKRDDLINHLFKIQTNIELYRNRHFNEFLRKTDYKKIKTIEDKSDLKRKIESLIDVGEKNIGEVIDEADEAGICVKDENVKKFILEKGYVYERVRRVKFSEFQKLYEYLEGKTPFSTQHKTKGAEYNNVLVVLDNAKWNMYNFEYLFTEPKDKQTVLERTRKIFYVCCTRAKENLAVYYHNPSPEVLGKAKEWFGPENVKDIELIDVASQET